MPSRLLILGTLGRDTLHGPWGQPVTVLGGAAPYAALGAVATLRLASPAKRDAVAVDMVALAGAGLAPSLAQLARLGVGMEGVHHTEAPSFAWTCRYNDSLTRRQTLRTENTEPLSRWRPSLAGSLREATHVLLGATDPRLQMHVLKQLRKPQVVLLDTIDLWIRERSAELEEAIHQSDVLVVNEEEARALTRGTHGSLESVAASVLRQGVKAAVIKRGSAGALLACASADGGVDMRHVPADTPPKVVDPTGTGDTFAGAMLAALALEANPRLSKPSPDALHRAATMGARVAAHAVADFGLSGLEHFALNTGANT